MATKRRSWYRRLRRWLLGTAVAALALSLAMVVPLRWVDPLTTAFMLRHHVLAVTGEDYRAPEQEWVALEHIAPVMRLAVVAAEDQKFPSHSGFDLESIADALKGHLREGERLRGASTLSQQVAKNLYLWPAQTLWRKGLEAWFTVLVELTWPKRRILEVYLNVAQFGPNTYGASAAAQRFFGASAATLSAEQAALLAAALPNPRHYRVDAPDDYLRERQQWILEQMRALGGPAWLEQALR